MLETILGQPYAVRVLQNAFDEGHLSGAYLFVGPDGVGKATAARQFAKMLCGAASDGDPIARAIETGTFPDVRQIEPPPSQIISVAQVWPRIGHDKHPADAALLRYIDRQPLVGQKQVLIILGAEGLGRGGADAGNSLLKNLEEPPPYAHFILTASSLSAVLPTIVSRCQVVNFGLLPVSVIEEALQTRFGVAPALARFLAAYCEGRLGRAVALAASPPLLEARERLLALACELAAAPPIQSFKLGEELRKIAPKLKTADIEETGDDKEKGLREPLGRALEFLATFYRDLLSLSVLGPGRAELINIDRQKELVALSARLPSEKWEQGISLIQAMRQAIERNANAQLAIEVLFTRLTGLGQG